MNKIKELMEMVKRLDQKPVSYFNNSDPKEVTDELNRLQKLMDRKINSAGVNSRYCDFKLLQDRYEEIERIAKHRKI